MKGSDVIMALLVIGFFAFIIYDGCNKERKKEHWVITGKEFKPGGMCCSDNRKEKFYAIVVPLANHHTHHFEASKFIIHIGKPYEMGHFETDSLSFFTKYRVAQKILY